MRTLMFATMLAATAVADEIAEKYPVAENVRGHENTEWSISYAYHLTDAKKNLPRVLLVGDSICQGYQGKVAAKLDGKANVTYWASSYCVTSPGYLRLLAFYLDEAKYDVIHFNNGLHSCETPVADYEKSYLAALKLVRAKQPSARLVWASSTPLNTENAAKAEKVVKLNDAARRAVSAVGDIGEDDLFALMNPLERSAYWVDMHHYSNAGYELIASQVVEKVTTAVSLGARSTLAGGRPYASIEAARDAARKMAKPAVVHLAAGTHRLEKPLVLKPEDSGVTYVADGDVVVSGARSVTDWRLEPDGTWSAPVPWVKSDRTGGFRSMRVNGAMRPRARLPKKGHFTVVNDDLPQGTRYNAPRPSFFYDPKEFNPEWANLKDAEIVCFHFWTDSHLRIASVDAVSNKVTLVTPSGKAFDTGWSNNKSGGLRGIYTIENLPGAMTEPGEWWLEYDAGRVHYRPMPGETPETIKAEVPFCPVLVSMEGTPENGRYVEDVVFRGIRFELSQFELPDSDVNNSQASASVSAAIRLVGARHCRFEDCTFADIGGYAVDILKGSRENVFSRCAMTRLGAGGVRLDGGLAGCPTVELNSGNVVKDCEIGPYGLDFRSAVGVLLKNAERTRIVHNHIHDGYYTGVSAGWIWGYYPSASRNNEISHNHIHDIGKGLLSDMGGIYTLGPSSGTRIANNRIHGVDARAYGGWGIYQDEGSTGILVENNVVYDTKFAPYDIHYAKEITVRNNIFAFGKKDQVTRSILEPHVSCELMNNIFYWTEGNLYSGNWNDAATPFAVHRKGNNKKANETGSTVTFIADRNVYFNPTLTVEAVKFGGDRSLDAWRKMGKDIHSVYDDPLFGNAAGRDFRLSPESPAFKMGFVDFDQSDIGPRKGEK